MSLLLAAALASTQAANAPPKELRSWAVFSKTPARNRITEKVEVGNLPGPRAAGPQFVLRRTVIARGEPEVSWTTTLACPGARGALAGMEKLSASPDVPGIGSRNDSIILDGVSYLLDAPAAMTGGGYRMTLSSNIETSLANWMESTLETLRPCWNPAPPRF